MMIGMVMTTAAAAMGPVGTVNCELPLKYSRAAGAVRELSVEVNEIANRKSFQHARKTRIALVTMPGAPSGAMPLMNAWNGVHPQRQAERDVGDDQPRPGVEQAQRARGVEQRGHERDLREYRDQQRHP